VILLFDVMDTLVYDPVAKEIPGFFGLTTQELFARRDPSAWRSFEVNAISEAECLNRLFAGQGAFDHTEFLACVRTAYRWVDGMEELVAELSARKVEMHTLSNYSSWYRMIDEQLAVSRFVAWSFVSFHTGVRKPAPEAYTNVVTKLGGPPSRFLFIDDREVNCAAARDTGMLAHRFDGVQGLREALRRNGVL